MTDIRAVGEVDPPNMSVTWYGDWIHVLEAQRPKPHKPILLYPPAAISSARQAALEEAAMLCEKTGPDDWTGENCARAIRALKDPT